MKFFWFVSVSQSSHPSVLSAIHSFVSSVFLRYHLCHFLALFPFNPPKVNKIHGIPCPTESSSEIKKKIVHTETGLTYINIHTHYTVCPSTLSVKMLGALKNVPFLSTSQSGDCVVCTDEHIYGSVESVACNRFQSESRTNANTSLILPTSLGETTQYAMWWSAAMSKSSRFRINVEAHEYLCCSQNIIVTLTSFLVAFLLSKTVCVDIVIWRAKHDCYTHLLSFLVDLCSMFGMHGDLCIR